MTSVLLVDDEPSVVDALSIRIPWQEIGVDEVITAYSAYEAVAVLKQQAVALVITDIRMPGMSGLELLEWIKVRGLRTKCMMLSGHADFEYAKQAMDLSALRYLLKPVADEEVIEVVKEQLALLQAEWELIASGQRASQLLAEHLPLLRGHLLNELLQGRRFDARVLEEKLKLLRLPFKKNDYTTMLLVRMEDEFAGYDEQSRALFEYAIGNMADELFSPLFECWAGKDWHDYLVYLVKPKQAPDLDQEASDHRAVKAIAQELQLTVNRYLKGSISIVASEPADFPGNLPQQYQQVLLDMRRSVGSDKGFFYFPKETAWQGQTQSLQVCYEPPLLQHLLEAGRWADAVEKAEAILDELEREWADSQEHVLEGYALFLSTFTYIAHRNGKRLVDLGGSVYYLRMNEGKLAVFIQQLREWVGNTLARMRQDMEQGTVDSRLALVGRVQDFVQSRLGEDVSLQAIADHVYLNPGYLSKVYKLVTGENLSDYLHRLRMERSAEMLKATPLKVYQIAERIGYQNPPYFIKIFKRHYGMTPQEFRDQVQAADYKKATE